MTVLRLRGIFLPEEEEREAWIVDGRLTFEPVAEAESIATGGWVLPGFVDAHCHIGVTADGWADEELQVEQAVLDRDAGALLLRDAGAPVDNTGVQRRADLPRLVRAGRHIARPRRYIRNLGVEVEPEDLVAEVERQARGGDGWIKLAADWIDREAGELMPVWPDDVLAAAIGRAHQLGVRVAAHTFSEQALPGLINAGLDSIEHGTGITADLLDEIARRGIAVVPTLINVDTFPSIADSAERKYPAYAAHMRALFRTSRQRIRDAFEAGVPIYTGTDAGGSLPHGLIREEVSGLVEGAPADLVVYDHDPRLELATLYAPCRIVLDGAVVG